VHVTRRRAIAILSLFGLAAFAPLAAAHAELVLSELIVDLDPGKQAREDIEVWNDSPERTYVALEPREILDAGLPNQSVRTDPDPQKLGLLVAPSRMILEPGQRKRLRIAALPGLSDREHVYRVTVKPVVGEVQSDATGLKLLVGYDVLVLVRPARPVANVTGRREGRRLTFSNAGNVSVEIVEGRQCAADGRQCIALPGKRLYPGASWTVDLQSDRPADYSLKTSGMTERRVFKD
jgi:P pilus assembly chaperone PapD